MIERPQAQHAATCVGTLIYDGDCGFCTASACWVARRARCSVRPWQQLDLAELGLTEADVSTAAYWLDGTGRATARGEVAIAAALRTARRPWSLVGAAIEAQPLRPLAALVYRWVAANRHRLPGRTPACRVGDRPS